MLLLREPSPLHIIQQQKMLSTPWFVALKAYLATASPEECIFCGRLHTLCQVILLSLASPAKTTARTAIRPHPSDIMIYNIIIILLYIMLYHITLYYIIAVQ